MHELELPDHLREDSKLPQDRLLEHVNETAESLEEQGKSIKCLHDLITRLEKEIE